MSKVITLNEAAVQFDTHQDAHHDHHHKDFDDFDKNCPLTTTTSTTTTTTTKNRMMTRDRTMYSIWKNMDSRNCLCVYWGISFITSAVDELVPLFLVGATAGFGLPERGVGQLLCGCGLLFAIVQYPFSSNFFKKFGTKGSIKVGLILSPLVICFVPFSVLLNQYVTTTTIPPSTSKKTMDVGIATPVGLHCITFWYLAVVLSLFKLLTLVVTTGLTIACNHSVSPNERARLNGLSVLGGSIMKGCGPAMAGILATKSVQYVHHNGSVLMFGTIGILNLLVAMLIFCCMVSTFQDDDHDSIKLQHGTPFTNEQRSLLFVGDEKEEGTQRQK